MQKEFTCINCPMGCSIRIEIQDNEIISMEGNTCKKGEIYVRNEFANPVRIVTTTVRLNNGEIKALPVKTLNPVPKHHMLDVIGALKNISVDAPVTIGTVVAKNFCEIPVTIVATKSVEKIKEKVKLFA